MDAQKIKQEVQSHYAAIARQEQARPEERGNGCGCGSGCCSTESSNVVELVDYGILQGDMVKEADLGLGCGLPTQHAGLQPGETVLDLGSGAGIDVFIAAKAVGPSGRVIGVDMTPEMLERARLNAARSSFRNVEFRQGEIEALPVEDSSVDVVLSNCVINLVPDKRRAFAEIHRVLKPGGRFSISDMVTYGDVPAEMRQDMELWAGCIAGAVNRQEYLDLIAAAGFSEITIHSSTEYETQKGAAYGILSLTLGARKA